MPESRGAIPEAERKENGGRPGCHVLVALGGQDDLWPLTSLGYSLARANDGYLTVLFVNENDEPADWLHVPDPYQNIPHKVELEAGHNPAGGILHYAGVHTPDLLLVGWSGRRPKRNYWLGSTLDPVLQRAPCPVLVVRAEPTWPELDLHHKQGLKVLVPAAGGPNAPLAIDLALRLSPHSQVTAIYITRQPEDEARVRDRQNLLAQLTLPWADYARVQTRVISASSVVEGILDEAGRHDVTMLGASREGVFSQVLFGEIPQRIAAENKGTTIIVRQVENTVGSALRRAWWWSTRFFPRLTVEERTEVYKQVRRAARPEIDFFVMISLSAGIASLGLMLNSPAVIIGAMLVAPLMAAILGLGLGMVQADIRLLGLSGNATVRGILLAILMGVGAGLILPDAPPTPEVMSRTAPSLLDMGVALISGLAGAYAICREDVSSALPGVAIAAALVPPLAAVGIGIAQLDMEIAGGALLLFVTNLITISAASSFVFFVLGFRPTLSKQGRTRIFTGSLAGSGIMLVSIFLILASLTLSSVREAALNRRLDNLLQEEISVLGLQVELATWELVGNDAEEGIKLEVQVRSNRDIDLASVIELQDRLAEGLQADRPLALTLIVFPTTTLNPVAPPTETPEPAVE